MSAAPVLESAQSLGGSAVDGVLPRLRETIGWCASLVAGREVADPVSEAARIDRIAEIERLQASLEALKCVEMVAFARSRAVSQVASGVNPRKTQRGIENEIALAGRVSPSEGARRFRTARRVTEPLSHLDRATRTRVDATLAGQGLDRKSPREAAAAAARAAYAADPVGSTARAGKARKDRRVTLRPAPDTMCLLTGLLPVEQGVACLAALEDAFRRAKAGGDRRSRGQVMAGTLVARLTGQQRAGDTGFEVGIVLPAEALLDPDDPTPAEVPGHGPLPAPLARRLIEDAAARCWWRRLFTRPTRAGGEQVVDLDTRRRRFTGWLAELIRWRDWTCRDPYCDAPIRHLDHIHRHADGGPTTPANGRGVCERGNYVRELPGWSVKVLDPDTHTVVTTTPTGHQYLSNPPQPP